ncbi:MAG: putative porin [Robiginitalea sp.]|nr:putative porin [Robiginitalea sp.]
MRRLLLLLFLSVIFPAFGQVPQERPAERDSLALEKRRLVQEKQKAAKKRDSLTIENYKIISYQGDTTLVDTTLTIIKEYKYNFIRKDDFELMPFSNIGQPYNRLGVNLNKSKWFPQLGALARHYNYFEAEDIAYYNVATPLTELFFKTTLERGQLLDAFLTFNTSPQLNVSIAYKGFRSIGKYREDEVITGNFRTSLNYATSNGRYRLWAHMAVQDTEGQENGGLLDSEGQFESGDPDFSDRRRVDILFSGVVNRLHGRRYYLDHELRLLKARGDSTRQAGGLSLGHVLTYSSKYYQYRQSNSNPYFGQLLFEPVGDQAFLKTLYNEVRLRFTNRVLGELQTSVSLYTYDYFFKSILETDAGVIPNRLNGEEVIGKAGWKKDFGGFSLNADAGLGLSGTLTDSFLDAEVGVPLGSRHRFGAGIHHSARKPNFNYLLYQSDYLNYNWDNSEVFENEQVQSLFASIESEVWGDLEVQYSSVNNYSYFRSEADAEQIEAGEERSFIRPFQQDERINHLRVKYQKEFRWRKWSLMNTVLYQEVDQSADILNVPSLITRNTLYFSSHVFRKAMYLQTGVTFKYFTEYFMDAYNPLQAEFYVQDREELGGFPMLDFFINAKVRQTRIYLKAEHFNSSFSGYRFFSAPNYPYRDFVIRFGLVWNFFS